MDWPQVEHRYEQAPEARIIASLKLLEDLLGHERAPSGPTQRFSSGVDEQRLPRPLALLLALAGVHVLLALAAGALVPLDALNVPPGPVLATALMFGAGAVVLALAGRADERTRPLAGVFLGIASAAAQPFLSALAASTTVPIEWVSALLPECFLPWFLWRFVRQFPRVTRVGRWSAWIARASTASVWVGGALFVLNAVHRLGFAAQVADNVLTAPLLRQPTSGYWLLLFALALPAPGIAYLRSREAEPNERRRVRFFVAGLAVGILPLLIGVLAEVLSPSFARFMSAPRARLIGSVVVYGFLLTIPLTSSYAIIAQRVLTLRLVLHRAAQLALARSSLIALVLVPWLALGANLWRQRDRPLAELLATDPTPKLLIAALAAGALLAGRRPLLARLERRLLGERADPSAVLTSFAQGVPAARDLQEVSGLVRRHAVEIVQATDCRLLVRGHAEGDYHPVECGHRPLAADSSIARLAAAVPDPFSTDPRDGDSFLSWLPESDRQWIADGDVHLIVPLQGSGTSPTGLLILAAARSGLAYTPAERRAVAALASAATLAVDRLTAEPSWPPNRAEWIDVPAGECRRCRRVVPRAEGRCDCGAPFEPAAIPFQLANKFRISAILGEGGMGLVYRAMDLHLERPVALKTLPRLRSDALLRLRREARAMAKFIHPNLALIFGAETWRGVPVLVVEYMDRGTLAERLAEAPLSPRAALDLAAKLAGALAAMHDKGLLHRDVKPSNIGFVEGGEPKLLDFGLARIVAESRIEAVGYPADAAGLDEDAAHLTRTDHLVGTPFYLSPEALAGEPPAPAQDLWSLHLVLWESLAGRHPFSAHPLPEGLRRLKRGEVPDVRTVRPDCPTDLVDLLIRGLHRRADRRRGTAAEVRDAFLESLRTLD